MDSQDSELIESSALRVYRRKLPHWRMLGATYFVTWRLAREQRDLEPEERTLIVGTLRYFEHQRYDLGAYVVMNDHVHTLVSPAYPHRLEAVVHSWKSFTANRMARKSRQGKIWQPEYFDRLIRSEAELLEKASYIMQNPRRRWPDAHDYAWVGVGRTAHGCHDGRGGPSY